MSNTNDDLTRLTALLDEYSSKRDRLSGLHLKSVISHGEWLHAAQALSREHHHRVALLIEEIGLLGAVCAS